MKQRYGSTQVCEFRLTQAEVDRLVIENVTERCNLSYDFTNPVLLKVNGEYVVRFIQRSVAQDGSERHASFKAFEVKP